MAKTTTVAIYEEDMILINSVKNQMCVRDNKKYFNWHAVHEILKEWRVLRKEAK